MTHAPDLLIIHGQGPVALACALFLRRRGVPASAIALSINPSLAAQPRPEFAQRTLALAAGSWQLLQRIINLPDAAPIKDVEVSIQGHAGRTRIAAQDLGLPALGYVMPYDTLWAALSKACTSQMWAPHVARSTPESCVVIHAQGTQSHDVITHDFHQSALLATVRQPGTPETHRAYERFTPHGPLALLPLPEAGRFGLVWCDDPTRSAQRAAGSEQAFTADLMRHLGPGVGNYVLESARTVVPLQQRTRRRTVLGHEVWIGNAAQSLHPVAGQGLNLGLRDAFELADILALAIQRQSPTRAALAAWARQRAPDRRLTLALTDLMARSFTWPGARRLQSPLLAALDLLPTLRQPLAHQLAFGHRRPTH